MLKTLLSVNEDLASSIALRYTAYLNQFVPLSLFITHVEDPDEKEQVGTGWVRRTWEDGVASNGKRLIDRMLQTENIDCPLAGRPKIFVGDRDKELTYELHNGLYNLFIEGYLNSADHDRFYERISSPLFTKTSCPILIVKNLSLSKKCALLCADSVDPKILVEKSMTILADSTFSFDIVYFKYKENEALVTMDREDGGSHLREVEALMAEHKKSVEKTIVLSGTPEQVGDYLKDYALVASTMPIRKCMNMYVLANSLASVLMVR
ncbi:MAG: hypothetical protein KKH60_07495 [Proteobacteria bacterium]|nr:hypothetical protein [Pseudomonadota bacterium]MBU1138689.1 hypothetical protein [Pseudomonadota bacterium]